MAILPWRDIIMGKRKAKTATPSAPVALVPVTVPPVPGMTVTFNHVDFGSLKALATVTIFGMDIRGFKVLSTDAVKPDSDQNSEMWVGMPSREVLRDGKKDYFDIVRFADDVAKKAFRDWMVECYVLDLKVQG
jgi:hypothetical protein